jgi:hypothetical protein
MDVSIMHALIQMEGKETKFLMYSSDGDLIRKACINKSLENPQTLYGFAAICYPKERIIAHLAEQVLPPILES